MILKIDAKFEEKLSSCFQSDTNLVNFDASTRNSQNFHFDRSIGVIFHGTEEWWNIWRKTDLWFGKWHEEHFHQSTWKILKVWLWWDPFIQSRKWMNLKFTEKLCVMTMKNEVKFEEELTCRFKIDMRNLTNFDSSTQQSQKFSLYWAPFEQSL